MIKGARLCLKPGVWFFGRYVQPSWRWCWWLLRDFWDEIQSKKVASGCHNFFNLFSVEGESQQLTSAIWSCIGRTQKAVQKRLKLLVYSLDLEHMDFFYLYISVPCLETQLLHRRTKKEASLPSEKKRPKQNTSPRKLQADASCVLTRVFVNISFWKLSKADHKNIYTYPRLLFSGPDSKNYKNLPTSRRVPIFWTEKKNPHLMLAGVFFSSPQVSTKHIFLCVIYICRKNLLARHLRKSNLKKRFFFWRTVKECTGPLLALFHFSLETTRFQSNQTICLHFAHCFVLPKEFQITEKTMVFFLS